MRVEERYTPSAQTGEYIYHPVNMGSYKYFTFELFKPVSPVNGTRYILFVNGKEAESYSSDDNQYLGDYHVGMVNEDSVFSVKEITNGVESAFTGAYEFTMLFTNQKLNFRRIVLVTKYRKPELNEYKYAMVKALYNSNHVEIPNMNFPYISGTISARHSWTKIEDINPIIFSDETVLLLVVRF